MPAVGYISDTLKITKPSWSNFELDGAAVLKSSETSTLPSSFPAKVPPRGPTQVLNVSWIKRIDCHPAACDEASQSESILNTENKRTWIADLYNPNHWEGNLVADTESNREVDNDIKDLESPEQCDVGTTANHPEMILQIKRS